MRFQERLRSVLRWAPMLAVVVTPCACADAFTSLAITTTMHLFFANAVIGIGEGILLVLLFRASWLRAIPLMIVANYLSAWAGFYLIRSTREHVIEAILSADPTAALVMLSNYSVHLFVAATAALYVLTVIVEWPLIFVALGSRKRHGILALAVSVLLQTVSYAILVPFYVGATNESLFTEVTIDPQVVSGTADNAWIYFLSDERNALCRVRINGTRFEEVRTLDDSRMWHYLEMSRENRDSPWNLEATSLGLSRSLTLVPEIGPPESFPWRIYNGPYPPGYRLPKEMGSDWIVEGRCTFLYAGNRKEDKLVKLVLETPLLPWEVRYVADMPDDRIVFQLGPRIFLLDPNTARLGGIAIGRCPTVVLDVDD